MDISIYCTLGLGVLLPNSPLAQIVTFIIGTTKSVSVPSAAGLQRANCRFDRAWELPRRVLFSCELMYIDVVSFGVEWCVQ